MMFTKFDGRFWLITLNFSPFFAQSYSIALENLENIAKVIWTTFMVVLCFLVLLGHLLLKMNSLSISQHEPSFGFHES